MEDTAPFLGGDGDVNVRSLGKRESAQYGIAVSTAPAELDVGKVSAVTEAEGVAQNIHLAVTVGAFGKFVHFLQQCQVGLVVGDHIEDPVRIVAPIDPTDAFVDIVAQELEFQEIYLFAGNGNPILCQVWRSRAMLNCQPVRPLHLEIRRSIILTSVQASSLPTLVRDARTRFGEVFGGAVEPGVAVAPGRVNLIGEHTDYNDGFVFPMAVDRYLALAFGRNERSTVRVHSLHYEESAELVLQELAAPGGSAWFDYIAAVFWALARAGCELPGLDMVVTGNIPIGAGLSSSAALELAVARAVADMAPLEWNALEMAKMAQRAENDYVGVSCGIMDQIAVAASKEGHALLLDCRTLDYSAVPLPSGVVTVVMDTGTRRALASGEYNQRRQSCEGAVRELQKHDASVRALRDVNRELLEKGRGDLDSATFRRAQHVIDENARTVEMAAALGRNDLERAGGLMNESHLSLRDLFDVSSPELDLISELARKHPACWGARMTGAGFGGCGVALVTADRAEEFTSEVEAAYRAETGLAGSLYVCRPVDGARLV